MGSGWKEGEREDEDSPPSSPPFPFPLPLSTFPSDLPFTDTSLSVGGLCVATLQYNSTKYYSSLGTSLIVNIHHCHVATAIYVLNVVLRNKYAEVYRYECTQVYVAHMAFFICDKI